MTQQRSPQKEAFWRQHVRQQRDSELSIRAYCRFHQLAENSFYAWRREIRIRDAEKRQISNSDFLDTSELSEPHDSSTVLTSRAVATTPYSGLSQAEFVELDLPASSGIGDEERNGAPPYQHSLAIKLAIGFEIHLRETIDETILARVLRLAMQLSNTTATQTITNNTTAHQTRGGRS